MQSTECNTKYSDAKFGIKNWSNHTQKVKIEQFLRRVQQSSSESEKSSKLPRERKTSNSYAEYELKTRVIFYANDELKKQKQKKSYPNLYHVKN